MHLVGVATRAGGDTRGKTMVWYGMDIGGAGFEMKQVAFHAADTGLVVFGIRKGH